MKNILFTLALLISVVSFGQTSDCDYDYFSENLAEFIPCDEGFYYSKEELTEMYENKNAENTYQNGDFLLQWNGTSSGPYDVEKISFMRKKESLTISFDNCEVINYKITRLRGKKRNHFEQTYDSEVGQIIKTKLLNKNEYSLYNLDEYTLEVYKNGLISFVDKCLGGADYESTTYFGEGFFSVERYNANTPGGFFEEYYPTNTLFSEGSYNSKGPIGEWSFYSENGFYVAIGDVKSRKFTGKIYVTELGTENNLEIGEYSLKKKRFGKVGDILNSL